MAVSKGEERIFVPEVRYKAEHARKIVRVAEAGVMVSKVETEDGNLFAAFNSELRRVSTEGDHVGRY